MRNLGQPRLCSIKFFTVWIKSQKAAQNWLKDMHISQSFNKSLSRDLVSPSFVGNTA